MGIVIPAGGQIYFQNAAALVGLIRKHHRCQLPIEIFYSGQEEYFAPAINMIEVLHLPALLLYGGCNMQVNPESIFLHCRTIRTSDVSMRRRCRSQPGTERLRP